jgi:hypothetical protein
MTDYESRLDQELLSILQSQRMAALGTLQPDGTPYVSLTPYAIDVSTGRVVLQVSALAPHAQHMRDDPRVSLLLISSEVTDLPSSSLPRITLEGHAEFLREGSTECGTPDLRLRRLPRGDGRCHRPDAARRHERARRDRGLRCAARRRLRGRPGLALTPLGRPLRAVPATA